MGGQTALLVVVVLVGVLCLDLLFHIIKKYVARRKREEAEKEAELELRRPQLLAVFRKFAEWLKTQSNSFPIWRAPDWSADFQKEEAYLQELFWDGTEGRIIMKRNYAESGSCIVGKYEPIDFFSRRSAFWLNEYSSCLDICLDKIAESVKSND